MIDNDSRPAAEKLVAARTLYPVASNAERVVGAARGVIRKEADAPAGLQATKETEDLVFWPGARARPLVPDLQYARDKVRGRDAAAKRRRDDIQKIIDGMPKE